jgi:glycosyltransferase involved in cell wall biosynthesis
MYQPFYRKNKNMNICMPAYTFYESDNRVRRYAETLAARGDIVDVVVLRQRGQKKYDVMNGVNVYRIQERVINEKGKLSYLFRLLRFFIKSMVFMTGKHIKKRYDLVHVHSVPDFEVFAALFVKMLGGKVILDIHDLVPEFYNSKFGTDKNSGIFKIMTFIEKISCSFVDHVIISNHIWFDTVTARSVAKNKCTTILNYPDQKIFFKRKRKRDDGKFIMIYPGTLNWHQGLDIAINAFYLISKEVPEAEFHMYGKGPAYEELSAMIKKLNLEDRVFINGIRPMDEIAEIVSQCDLGIIPKRNDPFGGEAFSTKTLEFMSLGVPMIISKTKIDQFYFNEKLVKFFSPDDEKDLADAMLFLIKNQDERQRLIKNAFEYIADNNWDVKKNMYIDLVASLAQKNQ